MRCLPSAVFLLAALFTSACEHTNPVQPQPQDALRALDFSASMGKGAKPEIDPTYANGETVYMIGPHGVANAATTMPNLYAKAEELYLVVFPQTELPTTNSGPITLPSGYTPQCNPCFHPGLPAPFVYHDHVITGGPGMGTHGTAGEYLGPWKIIVLMYTPTYAASADFKPLTSESAILDAEKAGGILMEINPGADDPYEVDTGNLLICPTVSSHA